MPMVGNDLGDAIVEALKQLDQGGQGSDPTELWRTIANAFVTYMQANAEVNITNGNIT